jgi:uncharacterized membrane protein
MIARGWRWIAATLLVAALVHGASLLWLPRFIMWRTMVGIAKQAGGSNRMLHPPRVTASSRGVVRPSPDLLYSVCIYDLDAAGGAVRVSTHGMPASYWSVSVFDANTNNFYALNDRQSGTGATDFLLMAQGASAPAGQMPVVTAPTSRGVVLFRTLVAEEAYLGTIDAARHQAACEPYGSPSR